MHRYYDLTKKPILISEINFVANDGSFSHPFGERSCVNQKERAEFFKWYATECFNSPYVIGYHWFIYVDVLSLNCGVVDLWDEPYELLTENMTVLNSKVYDIHENATFKLSSEESLEDYDLINEDAEYNIFYNEIENEFEIIDKDILETQKDDEILSTDYEKDVKNLKSNIRKIKSIKKEPDISIQEMIDKANPGDTIIVPCGFYEEKIVINKSLTIIGEDKKNTIICGCYNDNENQIVLICAENVTISNLTFTSHGYLGSTIETWFASSGITVKFSNNCCINNNEFFELGGWRGGWNILALKSNSLSIFDNNIFGKTGKGIIIDSCDNSIVRNNLIKYNKKYGIWISSSSNTNVSFNQIINNKFGLILNKADENTIYANTFKNNNKKGLCIKESNYNTISHNNFIKHIIDDGKTANINLNEIIKDNDGEICEILNYEVICNINENGLVEFTDNFGEKIESKDGGILDFLYDVHKYFSNNISKYQHANFFYCSNNSWDGNYWDRSILPPNIILPKIIWGKMNEDEVFYMHTNKDNDPLREPFKL